MQSTHVCGRPSVTLYFPATEVHEAVHKINADLSTIADLTSQHHLHINLSKSVALLLGSKTKCSMVADQMQIKIDDSVIPLVKSARNLGLTMDATFRYRDHISKCLQQAYSKLKVLYPHRAYLSKKFFYVRL